MRLMRRSQYPLLQAVVKEENTNAIARTAQLRLGRDHAPINHLRLGPHIIGGSDCSRRVLADSSFVLYFIQEIHNGTC